MASRASWRLAKVRARGGWVGRFRSSNTRRHYNNAVHQQQTDRFAFPLPARLLSIPGVRPLELEIAEVADLGPRMRRIVLTGAGLEDFSYQPGQDVMLVLGGGERPLSRRYTIRGYHSRSRTLELNILAHGVHGPGAAWAASSVPGDRVNGVGPRGKIFLDADADWHLFLGDETAAPGSLSMLEALAPDVPAQAYLEVETPEDELPTPVSGSGTQQVNWLYRGATPATASTMLLDTMTSAELPLGRGHVYIAGEVQVVSAVLRTALARGLAPDQVSAKAYWGRGKANESNGEPGEKAAA
jgi:NADPH-dependent ferric siderophore reductase